MPPAVTAAAAAWACCLQDGMAELANGQWLKSEVEVSQLPLPAAAPCCQLS